MDRLTPISPAPDFDSWIRERSDTGQETTLILGSERQALAVRCRFASDQMILLLHGLGCSQTIFESTWHQRALAENSMFSADLLGFGASAKPESFSYALEDQAKLIAQAIEPFRQHRFHIVGHSMGAAVGLLLAPQLADSLVSFACLEGNLFPSDGRLSRELAGRSLEDFSETGFLELLCGQKDSDQFDFGNSSPQALHQSSLSLRSWLESGELLKRFRELRCKKSYFAGEASLQKIELARQAGLPLSVVQGSGHFMMLDNPDLLASQLAQFACGELTPKPDI